ncbi:MAG: hypothetical protein LBB27_03120 [Tannerellaceae bacterium]|nr:hypothetical protein [Tannerellaceae bacterium]
MAKFSTSNPSHILLLKDGKSQEDRRMEGGEAEKDGGKQTKERQENVER